jgi:hypothetical protein
LNFTPANLTISSKKQPYQLVATLVTIARKEEATGPLDLAGAERDTTQIWRTALEDAIGHTAVFDDSAKARVSLNVKILKLDIPAVGITMRTRTEARYELLDRASGAVVFTKDIQSEGVVPANYAFDGLVTADPSNFSYAALRKINARARRLSCVPDLPIEFWTIGGEPSQ